METDKEKYKGFSVFLSPFAGRSPIKMMTLQDVQAILFQQREEIESIIENKLDDLMKNPGEEDQIALDSLEEVLKEITNLTKE